MNKKTLSLIAVAAAAAVIVIAIILGATGACSGGNAVVELQDPQSSGISGGSRSDSQDSRTDLSTDEPEQVDEPEQDAPYQGNVLPDKLNNIFECSALYQQCVPSEVDAEQALAAERVSGVVFGSAYFSSSRYLLEPCHFEVNEAASWDDMRTLGIDVSGLIERFGKEAEICSVRVFSAEDEYKTVVFLIDDSTLIAFGVGMHIFEYELVEAVG